MAISGDGWAAGQAQAVVLARGDAFPDALAGTPLAATKGGPLLLTTPTSLGQAVADELKRVLPTGRTVYLLGGTAAISDVVVRRIADLGYKPVRLAGADRYATATVLSRQIGNPTAIFEATGMSFPAALVAGVAAAKVGGVVVLTADGKMPAATNTYLAEHPSVSRIAVGRDAAAADPSARSIVGADNYQTARLLAEAFFDRPSAVSIASGTVFADALAGGAHAAKTGGPLVLSEPTILPTVVQGYLRTTTASISRGYLYGGTAALSVNVSDSVLGGLSRG